MIWKSLLGEVFKLVNWFLDNQAFIKTKSPRFSRTFFVAKPFHTESGLTPSGHPHRWLGLLEHRVLLGHLGRDIWNIRYFWNIAETFLLSAGILYIWIIKQTHKC